MEVAFDVLVVGLSDLVEDVADLVDPAVLDGGIDEGQGGEEAVAAVHADHALAGEAAPVEGGEQAFGGAFGAGELEVDDLLAPVGEDAEGDQHGAWRWRRSCAPTPRRRA